MVFRIAHPELRTLAPCQQWTSPAPEALSPSTLISWLGRPGRTHGSGPTRPRTARGPGARLAQVRPSPLRRAAVLDRSVGWRRAVRNERPAAARIHGRTDDYRPRSRTRPRRSGVLRCEVASLQRGPGLPRGLCVRSGDSRSRGAASSDWDSDQDEGPGEDDLLALIQRLRRTDPRGRCQSVRTRRELIEQARRQT